MINKFINLLTDQKIEITEKFIKVPVESSALKKLKVLQISDIHLNNFNIGLIERAVEKINALNVDIIVITGDIIHYGKKYLADLKRILKKLNAKHGKYCCMGNHDYSDGDNGRSIKKLYSLTDFRLLVNESEELKIDNQSLYFYGLDDCDLGKQDIAKTFSKRKIDSPGICLTHNAINFKEISKYSPDIVLSGHTHGGQLFGKLSEFICKYIYNYEYISGLYNLNDTHLYVNRGLGTSVLTPVLFDKKFEICTPRINNAPEITLFQFIN